ncbi:hypothetical protein [Klebsiella phage phiKp_21]|nr:hypothetical protein [Klebsiella phage phiKp_21]
MSLSNLSSSNSNGAFLDYGEFRSGVYIQTSNQILYFTDENGNKVGYQWKGLLPHTTTTNDPSTDGGISDTAWCSIVGSGFIEKLSKEGIDLSWKAHLPTVEVSYNLPHKTLKIWEKGLNSTVNDYWLYTDDGTVWGGVGVLGDNPDVPFKQIVPQNNVIEWSSIATEGQNQFTVPYEFTNISVFINGLLQNKSTGGYVVNGSTVTLNGSLKAGDVIHVVISNVPVMNLDYITINDLNANIVKTNSGSTVQNELDKMIINVNSYDELKNLNPLFEGQIVNMTSYYSDWESVGWLGPRGGKKFISVYGNEVDDGGYICVPTNNSNNLYWKALVNELNLFDFGVKVSNRKISSELRETSVQLQNAVNSSIKQNIPLYSSLYSGRSGYADGQCLYIKNGIDITGIKNMLGIYALVYKSSEIVGVKPKFDDDIVGCGYVLINMNCSWGTNGKLYGTSSGEQHIGTITTYNMDGRNSSSPMNGQLHCFSGSYVEMLSSMHCYGYGVRFVDCYDSIILDSRSLFSGLCDVNNNIEKFAIQYGSYLKFDSTSRVDESNALTVDSLVAHDCYDLAWSVVGSKNMINRVHEENTYITTTSRLTPTNAQNNNGFGYSNSVFGSIGGSIGAVSCSANGNNTIDHVFTFIGWGNSMNTFGGINLGISAGFAVYGGSIGDVRVTKGIIFAPNSRTNISRISTGGNVTINDDSSSVDSGSISGNLSLSSSASLNRIAVNGTTTITNGAPTINASNLSIVLINGGQPKINNTTISKTLDVNSKLFMYNCTINDIVTISNESYISNTEFSSNVSCTNTSCKIDNSKIIGNFVGSGKLSNIQISGNLSTTDNNRVQLVNVDVSGTVNLVGNNIVSYIQGGQFGRLTLDSNVTGLWQINPPPAINIAVDNWKLPTVVTGIGRMTVNPLTGNIYIVRNGSWVEYKSAS